MNTAESYIVDSIGKPAALEQLAEECAELAHAALKLARIYRSENPTPVTEFNAELALVEEIADVRVCVSEIMKADFLRYNSALESVKRERWKLRIDEKKGEPQCL